MIDSITKSTDQKYWLEAYAQYLKNVGILRLIPAEDTSL